MIKIIDQPKSFICTCRRCGCKFEYEYSDVTACGIDAYVINCPICNAEILHNSEDNKIPDSETITYPYTPSNIPGLPTSINCPPGKDLKIIYGTEITCENK
jgi:hypothetical protein